MEIWKKVEELIKLSKIKNKELANLKAFISKADFDQINDWLDTLDKTTLFFIMFHLSKDEKMAEKLKIIEVYFKHNY